MLDPRLPCKCTPIEVVRNFFKCDPNAVPPAPAVTAPPVTAPPATAAPPVTAAPTPSSSQPLGSIICFKTVNDCPTELFQINPNTCECECRKQCPYYTVLDHKTCLCNSRVTQTIPQPTNDLTPTLQPQVTYSDSARLAKLDYSSYRF